jgi:hypothetical protein
MYARQLRPFIDAYGRERLHVILSEELRERRGETLTGLFEFLDVDPHARVVDNGPVNIGGVPDSPWMSFLWRLRRKAPGSLKRLAPTGVKQATDDYLRRGLVRRTMTAQERAVLQDIYAPEVDALEALLDRPLASWRSR